MSITSRLICPFESIALKDIRNNCRPGPRFLFRILDEICPCLDLCKWVQVHEVFLVCEYVLILQTQLSTKIKCMVGRLNNKQF